MGKDKLLPTSRSRLFSPWHTHSDKGHSVDESMGKTMTATILSIEKHQLKRMEQDKEETEDFSLLLGAQYLGISTSEDTPFQLCQEDQDLACIYTITTEQTHIVTLAEATTKNEGSTDLELYSTDPQVRFVYNSIGEYFSTYVSGQIPKAFKIVPSLANWDFILLLTMPHLWTAAATLEATKIFLSFIRATQTKHFLQYVLLPNFRNHVAKSGAVEGPMYLALFKALQAMPSLFMKAFLLPLVESNCTILEASAVATLLTRYKVPVHATTAALTQLATLKFSLSTAILISVLLQKKQALPYRTVDALVTCYFMAVLPRGEQSLPHIWYQTLYAFVKNYRKDLIALQKQKLLCLIESVPNHAFSKSIQAALTLSESELAYSSSDSDSDNGEDSDSSDMMSE